jgi:hypothetical protein
MIFQGVTIPVNATGVVLVSSFVKFDPATKYSVIQSAGPQDLTIGISQQGSWATPGIPGLTPNTCTPPAGNVTPPAPTSTTPFQIGVYGIGSMCRLQLSPLCGTIIPGQLLTSAADGTGIDINNVNIGLLEHNYAGAIAMSNGSAGQFIRVLVISPFPIGGAAGGVTPLRVSLTPTTIGAFTAADQTFSIAGFTGNTNDPVVVSGEALPAGIGIVNAIALAPGSLKIRFANVTATSIAPSAQFFDILTL